MHLTPMDLRRIMPSLCWKNDLKMEGMNREEFLAGYAEYINTSLTV